MCTVKFGQYTYPRGHVVCFRWAIMKTKYNDAHQQRHSAEEHDHSDKHRCIPYIRIHTYIDHGDIIDIAADFMGGLRGPSPPLTTNFGPGTHPVTIPSNTEKAWTCEGSSISTTPVQIHVGVPGLFCKIMALYKSLYCYYQGIIAIIIVIIIFLPSARIMPQCTASQTDGQTLHFITISSVHQDRRTDNRMMPIADHTV